MTNLLFVYGTLRRGFCRHHILRRMGAKSEEQGSIPAELFALGEYPGARRSSRPSARVAGELYALPDAERAFKVLDAVEGFQAIAPEPALFKRDPVEVTLASTRCVIAWVYWLNNVPSPRRRISSGDYATAGHD